MVIGEAVAGGALAIGVADHLMMLEYSIYSVISPESCAVSYGEVPKKRRMLPKVLNWCARSCQARYCRSNH
ncbi:MAG: hypothetical protein R3A45_08660 [Bdellovibrionota bacterium]